VRVFRNHDGATTSLTRGAFQPRLHRRWALFVSPLDRLLRREAPAREVFSDAATTSLTRGVDEAHHIIVAAEVVNTSSDVQQLPMVLEAVKAHTESDAQQVLADAGYRSEAVMAELAQSLPCTELVIALGREGKEQARPTDAQRYPYTVAMQAKLQTDKARLPQAQMDCRAAQRLDQERAGVQAVQHAGIKEGTG
jgi:hypothetical protein